VSIFSVVSSNSDENVRMDFDDMKIKEWDANAWGSTCCRQLLMMESSRF
jgi:hypothetical protein